MPARCGHHCPQWKMMGRRQMSHLNPLLQQRLRLCPAAIQLYGYHLVAVGGKYPVSFHIARFLYAIDFVPAQQLDEKPGKILSPRADNDLFRLRLYPTERPQMLRNGLAQAVYSLSAAGLKQLGAAGAEDFPG